MEEKKYYQTTLAQDVVILQTKYCIDKRVVNILASMSSEKPLDFDTLDKAFNLVVERNDCLRIKFVKKDKQLMQYFDDKVEFNNIPRLEFGIEKEFDAFISKIRKSPIKYKKGVVVEPYFIKTHDNKYMVLLKVCHLVLDLYGINVIFKDLFEVYNALLNNTEMPEKPVQFETLIQKDLEKKNDTEFTQKNIEFYEKYTSESERPCYAGLHGDNSKIWLKKKAKGRIGTKMFLINCHTKGYCHTVDKSIVDRIADYCTTNKISMAHFVFYAMNICSSKINHDTPVMAPLELSNCRGTAQEKKCAGTKAQSACCNVKINFDEQFNTELSAFSKNQMKLYRHMGCSDKDMQMLLYKNYKYSFLESIYGMAFSFVPFAMPEGLDFAIYSNEKCALPAYIGVLYDINKQEMQIAYDVQTKLTTEQDVKDYHDNLVRIMTQVLDNPEILIKDIKVEL